MRALPLATAALVAALLAAPASGSHRDDLWATVNICDTADYPNTIGIRASMPGNSRRPRQRMYVRFRAQWYSREEERWHNLAGARTDWIKLGSARFESRQDGYTFEFDPPAGSSYVLRGAVNYKWRDRRHRHGRVRWVTVRKERENTKGGHSSQSGDPPGYSSGLCEIF
jgi:hypothetical protein